MSSDRAKAIIDGLTADVRRQLVYLALYPARVVAQNSDGTLEVKPDTALLPGLSKVPIRYGIPGTAVDVPAGARLLLGFDAGDPQRPYAALWDADAAVTQVRLGSQDASDSVALASLVKAQLDKINLDLDVLKAAITAAPVAPLDGGATFKASLIAALQNAGFPTSMTTVAATVTKAK